MASHLPPPTTTPARRQPRRLPRRPAASPPPKKKKAATASRRLRIASWCPITIATRATAVTSPVGTRFKDEPRRPHLRQHVQKRRPGRSHVPQIRPSAGRNCDGAVRYSPATFSCAARFRRHSCPGSVRISFTDVATMTLTRSRVRPIAAEGGRSLEGDRPLARDPWERRALSARERTGHSPLESHAAENLAALRPERGRRRDLSRRRHRDVSSAIDDDFGTRCGRKLGLAPDACATPVRGQSPKGERSRYGRADRVPGRIC